METAGQPVPRPVENTFAHRTPSPASLPKTRAIRQQFAAALGTIMREVPISRERSVAITHLEDAAMWAVKAIVCNDPDAVVEEL